MENRVLSLRNTNLSNSTINQTLADSKLILKEDHWAGFIINNPELLVKNLTNDTKVKNTLNLQEVKLLFNPETIESVWSEQYIYTINLIASQTWMRMGEIKFLTYSIPFPIFEAKV